MDAHAVWFVRCIILVRPDGREVMLGEDFEPEFCTETVLDDGPWDRVLAEARQAGIAWDASLPRGLGRVRVLRSILVQSPVPVKLSEVTPKQAAAWKFLQWQYRQPGWANS